MAYSGALTPMAMKLLLHQSEQDFQDGTVIPMAMWGGWQVAHTSDSRRVIPDRKNGGVKIIGDKRIKGFPDLTLVHPDVGVVIAELKREHGWEWKPGQREWLDVFAAVGAAQGDWLGAALNTLAPEVVEALGPMPRVYAALWRPGDIAAIEDVLIRHTTESAIWWPDRRP